MEYSILKRPKLRLFARIFPKTLLIYILLVLGACGTHKAKYVNEADRDAIFQTPDTSVAQRFYLIGDAGLGGEQNATLLAFKQHVKNRDTEQDWLVFLGDNIYPKGLPAKGEKGYDSALEQIKAQTDIKEFFKGNILFIPGNHDWYSNGVKGLKRQEEFVEKALDDKESFQPENGCALEKIEIGEDIVMLVIDSQWYITNWDKHPTINDDCDIRTREGFLLELEGELKKHNQKTILLAIHHPAFTYGLHGGYFNLHKHIFPSDRIIPLPILGSLVTLIRSQGGVSPQDRYNKRYNELMKRITTMTKNNDRVIYVSGHEHTLQYIEHDGIKQIISGAGSKDAPVALGEGSRFAYGGRGFAELDIHNDGSSIVRYFKEEKGIPQRIFSQQVYQPTPDYDTSGYTTNFPSHNVSSIYEPEKVNKSESYEWFWGAHYRNYYGLNVKAKVVTLDTLMGGMIIERGGGGHQTRSLRILDPEGRNFSMRAVKKSAVRFLQTVAFKETFVQDDFEDTLTEETIMDFYTSSHPFGAFVMGDISDAIGIFHTNPKLVYMPKHPALGKYNSEFGDELYILEERPDNDFLDEESFGNPDAIESTDEVLKNLRKDEEYRIDEPLFIRARLLDILVGDWDRHHDQWRWARFDHEQEDMKIYRPIPRDRDQVFSKYDGKLFDILKILIPAARQFQEFGPEIKDLRWLNLAGIKLDRTFIQQSGRQEWIDQAQYIQTHLTDEVIQKAFLKFPVEVQDEIASEIQGNLKERRDALVAIAERYYDLLSSLVIITGTDKDDEIRITISEKITEIAVARIKDGQVQPAYKQRVIAHKDTQEIWIYGLDDDDRFFSMGKGENIPKIKLVGGQNNDIYTIDEGRKITVYDHRSKTNTVAAKGKARFKFVDNYRYNNYRYDKYIDKVSQLLPSAGFNPDDGVRIGLRYSMSKRGFSEEPFQWKHSVGAGYFFATDGYLLNYRGEFSTFLEQWKIVALGSFTSENYTQNFFGLGNETENTEDEVGLDYNRVRTGSQLAKIGLVKRGHYGSQIEIIGGFESIEVQNDPNRFIGSYFQDIGVEDERKSFANLVANYTYTGADQSITPTRGMFFMMSGGVTTNVKDTERIFGYVNYSLEFYNALTTNRRLVLNTQMRGRINIGDAFEFYQAATLGANNGLRGFRNERFSGESSLALKGDLRYHLAKFKTGLLPLKLGIFAGGDVGRVWLDGEFSEKWHNDYGGGFWINALDSLSGNFSLFHSVEGLRFAFQFGLAF